MILVSRIQMHSSCSDLLLGFRMQGFCGVCCVNSDDDENFCKIKNCLKYFGGSHATIVRMWGAWSIDRLLLRLVHSQLWPWPWPLKLLVCVYDNLHVKFFQKGEQARDLSRRMFFFCFCLRETLLVCGRYSHRPSTSEMHLMKFTENSRRSMSI